MEPPSRSRGYTWLASLRPGRTPPRGATRSVAAHVRVVITGTLLVAMLGGTLACASNMAAARGIGSADVRDAGERHELERRLATLEGYVEAWRGTPHRLGGQTETGIDCSGFVQRLYIELFRRELPRTVARQTGAGWRVGLDALRPGDLVFFAIDGASAGPDHVGVYLDRTRFAHASSREGVVVSRLDAPYWRSRCTEARRLLP